MAVPVTYTQLLRESMIDDEGNIWVMTDSMPIFIYSTLDPNMVNFRVWKQNVYEAAKNTVCAP